MGDVLGTRRLPGYELNELVTALGESRSEAAIDLLSELAADAQTFEQCEHEFINAIATLNSPARTNCCWESSIQTYEASRFHATLTARRR